MSLKAILRINIIVLVLVLFIGFTALEYVEIPLIVGFVFQLISLFWLRNILYDSEKNTFIILGALVGLSILLAILTAPSGYSGESFFDKLGNRFAEALLFVVIITICTLIFEIYYWICLLRHL